MSPSRYRGRFAPSPTGPLHFGSLIAAIASYAEARQQQGKWLLRIEDVDRPRCDAHSCKLILQALETYGLHWDEEIIYQRQRDDVYQHALDILTKKQLSYGCACTRKETGGGIYPGTCRNGISNNKPARSIRVRTDDTIVEFNDKLQGHHAQQLARDVGDFIIKRADNLFAYQLAVVVDDEAQQITDVVRGSDMLDSTPRQIWLQRLLGYHTPEYMHIPLATMADGHKLSKQNKAQPIAMDDPRPTLINALIFLHQSPPTDLVESDLASIWEWIIKNWDVSAIPATQAIPYNQAHD